MVAVDLADVADFVAVVRMASSRHRWTTEFLGGGDFGGYRGRGGDRGGGGDYRGGGRGASFGSSRDHRSNPY